MLQKAMFDSKINFYAVFANNPEALAWIRLGGVIDHEIGNPRPNLLVRFAVTPHQTTEINSVFPRNHIARSIPAEHLAEECCRIADLDEEATTYLD